MPDTQTVYVELAARCYVDKELKEKGDIVALPADIAESFGTVIKQKPAPVVDTATSDDTASTATK